MKKICFAFFLILSICLFVLFSCAKTDSLYNVLVSVTASDESLPAGTVLCYGRLYENSVSLDTLDEYLGLSGYPTFAEKIEDFSFYSTLMGDYSELAAIRLYSADDVKDAMLFFERRIKDVKRTLNMAKQKGFADSAYIRVYGNTVVLYMMSDNAKFEKLIANAV